MTDPLDQHEQAPQGSQPDQPDAPHPETGPAASAEIEPISPAAAKAILDDALQPYLDDDWHVLDRGAYVARLTKGTRNLDFQVDLLGEVAITETELTPLQESGRLIAWALLIATLLVVLTLASVLGFI